MLGFAPKWNLIIRQTPSQLSTQEVLRVGVIGSAEIAMTKIYLP